MNVMRCLCLLLSLLQVPSAVIYSLRHGRKTFFDYGALRNGIYSGTQGVAPLEDDFVKAESWFSTHYLTRGSIA